MVDWLPTTVQALALYIPTVNCTELLRDGYFGSRVHAQYDLSYVLMINVVLMLLSLIAVRGVSVRVEGE